eukprot:jgi/Bigna1/138392/aug1.44_g13100
MLVGPDGRPLRADRPAQPEGGGSKERAKADVFGSAFRDFLNEGSAEDMEYDVVTLDYHESEATPIDYFFRSIDEMPYIERQALELCRGRVLDVGCGAGSHSLYLQEERQLDVTGIDISPGAIQVAKQRGLERAFSGDFLAFKPGGSSDVGKDGKVFWDSKTHKKYETILFMMNGAGMAGNAEGLDRLLQRARALLAPGGQILIDSTDIQYMYTSEDGSQFEFDFDPKEHYYGETLISVRYKGMQETFPWLFIDFEALRIAAQRNGLEAIFVADEAISEEDRGVTYLAKLIPIEGTNPLADQLRDAQVLSSEEAQNKIEKTPILGEDDN